MKTKMIVMVLGVLLVAGNLYAANGDLIVNGNFNLLPAGTIVMYGGSTLPSNCGWLLADGRPVSRTTYSALFAVMGTTYGAGDGSTTFNLPDFRGIFPKGAGTTNRADGKDASGNYYSGTLGSYSQDKMQGHYHGGGNGGGYSRTPYSTWGGPVTGGGDDTRVNGWNAVTDGTNGIPRTGHTTEPQSLSVNFIVKY